MRVNDLVREGLARFADAVTVKTASVGRRGWRRGVTPNGRHD